VQIFALLLKGLVAINIMSDLILSLRRDRLHYSNNFPEQINKIFTDG